MSAALDFQKLSIIQNNIPVTVPNNDLAKLMYYLHCVDNCIDLNIESKLIQYKNHQYLNFDEINEVLKYATKYNPSFMTNKNIFINNSRLCGDYNNKFYELTYSRFTKSTTDDITFKTQIKELILLMTYTNEWMEKFYNSPIKNNYQRIQFINNGRIEELRPRTHIYDYFEQKFCLLI